jgi:hypothetical protein
MNVKVQQATAGIVVVPTGSDKEYYQYTSSASSSRLPAKGTTSLGFTVWYDLPNKVQEGLVTVTFSFTDDANVSFSESPTVQVH